MTCCTFIITRYAEMTFWMTDISLRNMIQGRLLGNRLSCLRTFLCSMNHISSRFPGILRKLARRHSNNSLWKFLLKNNIYAMPIISFNISNNCSSEAKRYVKNKCLTRSLNYSPIPLTGSISWSDSLRSHELIIRLAVDKRSPSTVSELAQRAVNYCINDHSPCCTPRSRYEFYNR